MTNIFLSWCQSLLTTSLGADWGFMFLWLILFSCLIKVFVQIELGRYAISSGETFQCDVVRSDWHHTKNMFVVACRYSKRSISPSEYQALMNASDWQIRALI